YAMMMAKKFGWVKDYDDWRIPRIAQNYVELLEKEIPRYKKQIDFVHLCFMSDPFMYDTEKNTLVERIKETTLKIIEILNKAGIRVTTLTKGIYPNDLVDTQKFSIDNEYGITLVSLNDNFKEKFEPFSAPYELRINSLKTLANHNLKTWVSIEPYPTPELDPDASNIEKILETVSFVKKIIFGKLNYRKLTAANYTSNFWKNNEEFYREIALKVINFCRKNGIKYHIKFGTPLSSNRSKNILRH
ncbi:MAG: radical SAM protein, partial [candidate division WOR-3 bacterium]